MNLKEGCGILYPLRPPPSSRLRKPPTLSERISATAAGGLDRPISPGCFEDLVPAAVAGARSTRGIRLQVCFHFRRRKAGRAARLGLPPTNSTAPALDAFRSGFFSFCFSFFEFNRALSCPRPCSALMEPRSAAVRSYSHGSSTAWVFLRFFCVFFSAMRSYSKGQARHVASAYDFENFWWPRGSLKKGLNRDVNPN